LSSVTENESWATLLFEDYIWKLVWNNNIYFKIDQTKKMKTGDAKYIDEGSSI
jgi:glutamine cyclotransferase